MRSLQSQISWYVRVRRREAIDWLTTQDGRKFDLIRLEKPESHYMLLEADTESTGGQRGKCSIDKIVMHVICLDKKSVMIFVQLL